MMKKMKELAALEDVSVSDLVRKATQFWIERYPVKMPKRQQVPVVDAGRCLVSADAMKETIYE